MAAFDPEADLTHPRDYRLMMNTSVTLFWRQQVLDDTTSWLRAHGYQVTELDAAAWSTELDLHRSIAAALRFPDYYGRNLDALNDCMRDVVSQDYTAPFSSAAGSCAWSRATTQTFGSHP